MVAPELPGRRPPVQQLDLPACSGSELPMNRVINALGQTLQTPYELQSRSCDFTAHLCTGIIHENYKLFVNPLFKTNQFCTYTYL